ncbi:MAG: pyridoxamine 5'-phosphate oxidase family protein [Burkholderiales bacterium]
MSASDPVIDQRALRKEIAAFLDSQHVVSLATVVEGAVHAACVMYAPEDLSLCWTSDPDTRHSLAIERDPRVAATVAPDYTDFRLIRGIQIAGRARRLGDAAETAHARELLRRRFPFLRELDGAPAALRAAIDKAAYYRLDPDTITLIDNTRGFGDRRTLRIP